MSAMFIVRVPSPRPPAKLFPAYGSLSRPRATAFSPPDAHLAPACRIVCALPCHSAVSIAYVFNQPAELQHFQRHKHGENVQCVCSAPDLPRTSSRGPSPDAAPAPDVPDAAHARPAVAFAAAAFPQPAAAIATAPRAVATAAQP